MYADEATPPQWNHPHADSKLHSRSGNVIRKFVTSGKTSPENSRVPFPAASHSPLSSYETCHANFSSPDTLGSHHHGFVSRSALSSPDTWPSVFSNLSPFSALDEFEAIGSNSDALTGNNYNCAQPPLHHRSSSHPGYNEPPIICSLKSTDDSSSLANLASRFSILLNSKGGEELDLNDAVQHLGVPKRRIYDITCVMEGCGMIEKRNKNKVVNCCKENESEVFQKKTLENDIKDLKEHEQTLDDYINCLQQEVKEYTLFNESKSLTPSLYVTKREVASIESYINDTVLAIRAPPKTSVYVPLPDQVRKPGMRKFQIQLTCPDKNSVYIHEIKCGNKMARERPRNLARPTIHPRPMGMKDPIQNMRHMQIPTRGSVSNYSVAQTNDWVENRGENNYRLQEKRETKRIRPTLPYSADITSEPGSRVSSSLMQTKSHMHPPQLPSKDSYVKRLRPIEPSSECADRNSVNLIPLKRKHTSIGLRPISRNRRRDGELEMYSYARRRNNTSTNQSPLSSIASDNMIGSCSEPNQNEVEKCNSDTSRPTSSCGYLSPGNTRKEMNSYKENYATRPLHDGGTCGPSPNTRAFELLNAPLDSPLLPSPRPCRYNGRTSADGCAHQFYSSPLAFPSSPFTLKKEDYTVEETTPNFFSISPMHRA